MTEQTTEERQASHRLPRTVEPRRYELVISPDLDRATFRGEEQIDVVVHEATEEIVLNALELTVEWAELVSETGSVLSGNVRLDEESGRAVIALSAEATPGPWTLRTSFSGTINDKLHEPVERVSVDAPAGPFRAGTSPTARPSSRSRSWSIGT